MGPHTEGAAISDLDGIHTLTCALMLLNTDLHGHVSWGGGEERCPLTDSPRLSGASPFSSPLPETYCLGAMLLQQTGELGSVASRHGPALVYPADTGLSPTQAEQ